MLRDLFDQGQLVGERAREEWPGGLYIDGDHKDRTCVPRTKAAIDTGASVLFEACFEEDGVFCAVDVLERAGEGWTLIEVKSSHQVKEYHLPDVAVQVHVARLAGLNVVRAKVMHLNREYRLPSDDPSGTAGFEPATPEPHSRVWGVFRDICENSHHDRWLFVFVSL